MTPTSNKIATAVCLVLALCLPLSAAAAGKKASKKRAPAKPAGPPVPGNRVELTTKDGWTLVGNFQAPASPERYTFLLLHGVGSSKGEWGALATRLAAEGYGILAYDGRGHGDSQTYQGQKLSYRTFRSTGTDNEWNQMLFDVESALVYLSSQSIQSSSVAFCGASIGANILLKASVQRKEIPLVVLLSPGINYRDVMTVNPIRAYGKRPLLIVASSQDKYSFQSSQLLYQLALPVAGADNALLLQAPERHGAPMLDDPAMMDVVVSWIRAEEKGEPFSISVSTMPVAASTTTVPSKP